VLTFFEENDCEIANTHAHIGLHLVVLAHLQRRWSLRGREGFGSSLPPTELVRQDLAPIFHCAKSGVEEPKSRESEKL